MFHFKQFSITQERSAMKVGEDAVILGSWVDVTGVETILDIGSGTGILSLMMAQRNHKASITALEVDADAFEDTLENVGHAPFRNIQCVQEDVFDHQGEYDLIVCNPPYFEGQLDSQDASRQMARQNMSLSALFSKVDQLINAEGRFVLILPSDRFKEVDELMNKHGWNNVTSLSIRSRNDNEPHRIIFDLQKNIEKSEVQQLTVRLGDKYTDEFKKLTEDFYLAF